MKEKKKKGSKKKKKKKTATCEIEGKQEKGAAVYFVPFLH